MVKLTELRLPDTLTGAEAVLNRYGYKNIGGYSAFGRVFHKAGEKSVLKIFTKDDIAYRQFVSLAIQNKDNPHFPRFARKVIQIKGTQYDAVKTELLTSGNEKDMRFIRDMFKIRNETDKMRMLNKLSLFAQKYNKTISNMRAEYTEWLDQNKQLVDAFDIIKSFIDKNKTSVQLDLHEQNMMMRGNTIVIIDPVRPKQ